MGEKEKKHNNEIYLPPVFLTLVRGVASKKPEG